MTHLMHGKAGRFSQNGGRPGDFITVFADASFCAKSSAWGYGFWVKWGFPAQTRIGWGGGLGMVSSHKAEVQAVLCALEWVRDNLRMDERQGKHVCIQSDCTGAIRELEPHFERLRIEMSARRIYAKHVKGHQGHVTPRNSVNTTCDRHAGRVMRQFRDMAYREGNLRAQSQTYTRHDLAAIDPNA